MENGPETPSKRKAWRIILKAVGTVLLFPFAVLGGLLGSFAVLLVILPLLSMIQLLRFAVDARFRSGLLRGPARPAGRRRRPGYYFHPCHTWARFEKGSVTIGLDEFTRSLLGRGVRKIECAKIGTELKSGEPAWRFRLGDRTLEQPIPLGCTVIEVNGRILRKPSLLERLAVEDLWLMKVSLSRPFEGHRNRLTLCTEKIWNERVRVKILARFCGEAGLVYTDGGTWVSGFAEDLTDGEWEELLNTEFK